MEDSVTPALKISAGVTGCFHQTNFDLEILSGAPCIVWITDGAGIDQEEYHVSSEIGRTFLDRVREILDKPEKLRGGRSTTVYYATALIGGREISARSSELLEQELVEIANDPRA